MGAAAVDDGHGLAVRVGEGFDVGGVVMAVDDQIDAVGALHAADHLGFQQEAVGFHAVIGALAAVHADDHDVGQVVVADLGGPLVDLKGQQAVGVVKA